MMKDTPNTATPTPAQAPLAQLAPELAAIALAWKAADIPDLYEGFAFESAGR